jgi:hypothetical protein
VHRPDRQVGIPALRVAENLDTFFARQEQRERTVPRFLEREFRSFLDCGIPAQGFLRVHFDECGRDKVLLSIYRLS